MNYPIPILFTFVCLYVFCALRYRVYESMDRDKLRLSQDFILALSVFVWIAIIFITPDNQKDFKFYIALTGVLVGINGIFYSVFIQLKNRIEIKLRNKKLFRENVDDVRYGIFSTIELIESRRNNRFEKAYYNLSRYHTKMIECLENCPKQDYDDRLHKALETYIKIEKQLAFSRFNRKLKDDRYKKATIDLKRLLNLLNDINKEIARSR